MRMPEQMLSMMRGRMPNASTVSEASCARMTEVGKERITVPAGTFQTTHYRDSTGGTDVWVSPSVPFGAVKVVSRDHTLELTGNGTGGTTKITGTAKELGVPLTVAASAARADTLLTPDTRLLMVDLATPTTEDDLRRLRAALPETATLLAYGSHVETERLRSARAAGCEPVLPRSEFTKQLVELLRPLSAG